MVWHRNVATENAGVRAVIAIMLCLVMALSACTIGDVETSVSGDMGSVEQKKGVDKPAPLKASVKDGANGINPREAIKIESAPGGIKGVTMVNENDHEVEATLSKDGSEWHTDEVLGYHRSYTIKVTRNDNSVETIDFTTTAPKSTTGVALSPIPGSTVGVGQAVHFIFTVAPTDRETVQNAITITTSNDTEGAFYWVSANELRWRPKDFWEPGTEVTVEADIYGLDMGEGLYGTSDNSTNFVIGDDVRAVVDNSTKTMKVYKNGELLRSVPVSLGRDTEKFATPNGTYVVGDEYRKLTMDSETFGLPHDKGGYKTTVDFATQLSYSGIYVHAAPWSVNDQGVRNVSHGCVNVTTETAEWFQEVVKRGDPVIVENTTGGTLRATDGLGHWNMDWETWKAGNAKG